MDAQQKRKSILIKTLPSVLVRGSMMEQKCGNKKDAEGSSAGDNCSRFLKYFFIWTKINKYEY